MSVQILGTAMYFPGRYPPLPIVLDWDDLGSGWFIHFCWQWAIIQSSIAKGQICIFPFGHSSQAESPDSFPFAGVPTEYAWCWGSSFWKHLLSSAVHQRLMLKGRKVSPCSVTERLAGLVGALSKDGCMEPPCRSALTPPIPMLLSTFLNFYRNVKPSTRCQMKLSGFKLETHIFVIAIYYNTCQWKLRFCWNYGGNRKGHAQYWAKKNVML